MVGGVGERRGSPTTLQPCCWPCGAELVGDPPLPSTDPHPAVSTDPHRAGQAQHMMVPHVHCCDVTTLCADSRDVTAGEGGCHRHLTSSTSLVNSR